MIERIYLRNFKSLNEIKIPLKKFTCLIGMNGAGKSTVLQSLDFMSQLMIGNVQEWLLNRNWQAHDLNCKFSKESNIKLGIAYRTKNGKRIAWECTFNRNHTKCSAENIWLDKEKIWNSNGQEYGFLKQAKQSITFLYQGSILSQLKDSELSNEILEFRDAIRHFRSLELLSPHLMRKSARNSDIDIGSGGEKLAGYLHSIKGEPRADLIKLLKIFYPNVEDFKVTNQRAGWKKLSIVEKFGSNLLETEASHISDGLLRILAILAQSGSDRTFILLDEIENGINPEIIEKLVDTLVCANQQIIITTHSPMILNYMEDDIARESVQFVYKNEQGETHTRPFFSIPRIGEKLNYMGAGEAFVDTDMVALTQECVELDDEENFQAGFNK
jgi:predicted ATPase